MSTSHSYGVWSTANADWYSVSDTGDWDMLDAQEALELDIAERPELEGTLIVKEVTS